MLRGNEEKETTERLVTEGLGGRGVYLLFFFSFKSSLMAGEKKEHLISSREQCGRQVRKVTRTNNKYFAVMKSKS